MASIASITKDVISQAEIYEEIRAGIVCLKDVLKGSSYEATPEGSTNPYLPEDVP